MKRIHFIAAPHEDAQKAFTSLTKRYGQTSIEKADAIVPLGGDGTLLQTLHMEETQSIPVFALNKGSVGFLTNPYHEDDLIERLNKAERFEIHPLKMRALDKDGQIHESVAFNEVALFRASRQAAKISVYIDDNVRINELVADGIMVASPAGSTAYNFSAHGPILPLSANVLALTPISPFRPRRWRGALLPQDKEVRFVIHDPENRPVSANADSIEIRDIHEIDIWQSRSIERQLLFDPDENLEERILNEQFVI